MVDPKPRKLLDQVRDALRLKQYAYRPSNLFPRSIALKIPRWSKTDRRSSQQFYWNCFENLGHGSFPDIQGFVLSVSRMGLIHGFPQLRWNESFKMGDVGGGDDRIVQWGKSGQNLGSENDITI